MVAHKMITKTVTMASKPSGKARYITYIKVRTKKKMMKLDQNWKKMGLWVMVLE